MSEYSFLLHSYSVTDPRVTEDYFALMFLYACLNRRVAVYLNFVCVNSRFFLTVLHSTEMLGVFYSKWVGLCILPGATKGKVTPE